MCNGISIPRGTSSFAPNLGSTGSGAMSNRTSRGGMDGLGVGTGYSNPMDSGRPKSAAPSLMNKLLGVSSQRKVPEVVLPSTKVLAAAAEAEEAKPPPLTPMDIAIGGPDAPPENPGPESGLGTSRGAQVDSGRLSSGRPRTAGSARGGTASTPTPFIPVKTLANKAGLEPGPGIKMVIAKLKKNIQAQGMFGFVNLHRIFSDIDEEDTKSLDLAKFKCAMKEMDVVCSDADLRMCFEFFDADRGGTVSYDELVRALRDPLKGAREAVVLLAFDKLDRSHSGMLEIQDVAGSYDSSKHPEVAHLLKNGPLPWALVFQ